ncbi:MAG: stage III sporulation protein AB [Firmicutes bacterium]|nr:stage III sporulation protein AB [Bacillota bacterium]
MDIGLRFLIASICAAAGSLVGLFFSKRLRARAGYYEALSNFVSHLLTEVRFRKNPVKAIAAEFTALGETPFSKNLGEYIKSQNPQEIMLSKGALKKAELPEVQKFFSSLGTLDASTQIFELEAVKDKFAKKSDEVEKRRDRYASMYVKLGFFAGLALGILVL